MTPTDFNETLSRLLQPALPHLVGVAVSGGGDSMALLRRMAHWAEQTGRKLAVATVDHQLRDGTDTEIAVVRDACLALGLGHRVLTWNDWDHRGNLQDAARSARRRLLGSWAAENGISHIGIGHTLDDQAETFLIRLARGSGVDGLSGMSDSTTEGAVTWIRPLLSQSRAELRVYLRDCDQVWAEDPSNEDDRFIRVKMRKAQSNLDALGLDIHTLAKTADTLRVARRSLEAQTLELAKAAAQPTEAGSVLLSLLAIQAAPEEQQHRVIAHVMRWVSGADYRPRRDGLRRAIDSLASGQKHTLAGCIFIPKGDEMVEICQEFSMMIKEPLTKHWHISVENMPKYAEIRALGAEGLALCPDWKHQGLSRDVLLVTPSIWVKDELIAAPFAGRTSEINCERINGVQEFFKSILTH